VTQENPAQQQPTDEYRLIPLKFILGLNFSGDYSIDNNENGMIRIRKMVWPACSIACREAGAVIVQKETTINLSGQFAVRLFSGSCQDMIVIRK
jgi:hypothetical protein